MVRQVTAAEKTWRRKPRKRKKKLSRFNLFSVGRAAVLFSRGLPRKEVVGYYLRRYGRAWGIKSRIKMEGFVFVGSNYMKPNFEMFEGKSVREISRNFRRWVKHVKFCNRRARQTLKRRWKDPDFRQANADANKKRNAKLQKDPKYRRANRARFIKMSVAKWRDPDFRQAQAGAMKKQLADPAFRMANREAVIRSNKERCRNPLLKKSFSRLMRERWKKPEFRRAQAEAMKKKMADPEFRRARAYKISRRMREMWADPIQRQKLLDTRRRKRNIATHDIRSSRKARGIKTGFDCRLEQWCLVSVSRPEDALMQKERARLIEEAMMSLPETQRIIVAQSVFQGDSLRKISRATGLAHKQVKRELELAYSTLAESLAELS